jgi:serine/threonine protein kinase
MPESAGRQLTPSLRLLSTLGQGGMGVVYRAFDLSSQREVAVKLLLAEAADSGAQRERFTREAFALAKIRHANVVRIHSTGEVEGRPYIVMDLVEGRSLGDRLQREGALAPREAAELFRKVALGLAAAHQESILHRDLKPANVLLTEAGEPRLTDFGLARDMQVPVSDLTKTGIVTGTPGYLAPEQARGEKTEIGPSTDVYGLGACLYESLTGALPFTGAMIEVLIATSDLPPEPPSTRCPGLDSALEAIVLKCLEKRPEDRYASAREVAEDLERFLAGRAVLARTHSRWHLPRWLDQRRGRGAGLVLLAGLGGAGALVWLAGPRPQPVSRPPALRPSSAPSASPELESEPEWPPGFVEARASARKQARAWGIEQALETYDRIRAGLEPGSELLPGILLERAVVLFGPPPPDSRQPPDKEELAQSHRLPAWNGQSYFRRGLTLMKIGALEDALPDLDRSLEFGDVDQPMALSYRGRCKARLRDFAGAIRDFDAGLVRLPDNAELLYRRGRSKLELGRVQAAVEDFTRSIANRNRDDLADCHLHRGLAHAVLGDDRAAIEDFGASLELDSGRPRIHRLRGEAFARLGDLRAALKDLSRGTVGRVLSQRAMFLRALVYSRAGMEAKANKDLQRVLFVLDADHPARAAVEAALRSR